MAALKVRNINQRVRRIEMARKVIPQMPTNPAMFGFIRANTVKDTKYEKRAAHELGRCA